MSFYTIPVRTRNRVRRPEKYSFSSLKAWSRCRPASRPAGPGAAGGDGVARVDGLTVFVPRSAPGDLLRVRVTRVEARFARAEIDAVLEALVGEQDNATLALVRQGLGGRSPAELLEPDGLARFQAAIAADGGGSQQILSQILMASTYPADVKAAAEWSKAHPDEKGDAAVTKVDGQPWDPSVKSLVAFPQVLAMMREKPTDVQRLGDAFLADPGRVMDRVQFLRSKAQQAGNLKSNEQVKVTVEPGMGCELKSFKVAVTVEVAESPICGGVARMTRENGWR